MCHHAIAFSKNGARAILKNIKQEKLRLEI
jgi:hypothetical protein